jgi:hypothetical protein
VAVVFRPASVTRFDRKRDGANLSFVAQSFVLLALSVTPLNKQNDVCANPVVKRPAIRFDHQPQNLLLQLPNVLPVARQTDWQIIPRRRTAHYGESPNLLASTLSVVGPAPFTQTDWPNPHRQKRLVTAKHFRAAFNPIGAVAPTVAPFSLFDWPNPSRRKSSQHNDASNLLLSTLASSAGSPAPFAQLDWPNPIRPKNLLAAQSLYVASYATVIAPFFQSEWTNPTRRKWYQPEQLIPNLLTSTLVQVVAGPAPFYQIEWTNPARRKPYQQNDAPNLLLSTFIAAAPPPPPFYQGEWYTPSKKRWTQYRDHTNLLLSTLPSVQPPFTQSDWANPVRKARFDVSGSCVSLSLVLTQTATAPPVIYADRIISAAQPMWTVLAGGRYVGR